ncbi:MAG: cupin domain-containing protein [Ferrimicrobium sp.]|jgi:mannose-6-phosphate isomerase-like protein (cupin superfamily)|uniref:cupin domain-containing protein n=1 Tax=Ferrimicrobium TaxID=121038 RepID=UPI0023101222|nr:MULTISPECIES: cupin domain-containing protein [Ferrimicrobium]MCL5973340.1 cupin domain-containing protein [Actinomycetota bacterium]MDA8400184.1 cupin domain-containing protein [Actinomycetota bacterium]
MREPSYVDVRLLHPFRISADDSVKLAVLKFPTLEHDTSVVFEVWDPGGAQPLNSHPRSFESFFFLHGSGTAICDGDEIEVSAGGFLVLPPMSQHRIVNRREYKLYAITTMSPDDGFAALIESGVPTTFDEVDYEMFSCRAM